MADGRTIVFFPEGAYGPTNNCVGIGTGAARARPSGRVHRRGVVRGHARGKGLRGTADAPRAAARGARGPRPVLDRLHPGHRAGLPQAHARAARRVHRSDVAGAHRRREVRQPAARGDHRRARAGRDRRGQRRRRSRRSWRPGGRGSGSCRATRPSSRTRSSRRSRRATRPTTAPPGRRSSRSTTGRMRDMWADFDAFCREHGAGGLADGELGPDFMHESPYLNLYSYPAEADYARANPLGPTWHRSTRPSARPTRPWELPATSRERAGALIYLSLGSLGLGGCRADAAAGRPAGPDRPPGDRVEGTARATRSRSTTT